MKAPTRPSLIVLIAFAATVELAYGAPPPNVVSSDADGNTAMGTDALAKLSDGKFNTASGSSALNSNTSGAANTASGVSALNSNTTGNQNTASGFWALFSNTTGSFNTASGNRALFSNTTGNDNTASGSAALFLNTTGSNNTASGSFALFDNTKGHDNSASGFAALESNTTGNFNTAFGSWALVSNTRGDANTALGGSALSNNSTGNRNVAVGYHALFDDTAGRSNTAIGAFAGRRITGNDNVDIANTGFAGESQTMRLGTQGSEGVINSGVTRTFVAGINGVTTGRAGVAVVIDSRGQLGTISSSRRYKQDIRPMADASERLMKLQPVTFRYQEPDAAGEQPIQYGLIAEDVAEVFPELVVLNENGQPESVAYHLLPALLLNEMEKEHRLNQLRAEQLAQLQSQVASQASQLAEISALKQQLAEVRELLAALQPQTKKLQVAQR